MAVATAAQAPAKAGQLFGLPGVTRRTSQRENNDGLVTTLSQTAQVDTVGLIPFKQSDVVYGWTLRHALAVTPTAGTQTITVSPYFPYNYVGPVRLNLQNQFDLVNVESGIDLALRQSYRPMQASQYPLVDYTNIPSMYSPQTNLVSASNYTNASTAINLRWEIPAGIWFEQYYPLAVDGTVLGQMGRTLVSPQYMAGTSRIVLPSIRFNQAFATTSDNGPYTISGTPTTPATFTGTATHNIQRHGWYQPQGPSDSIPVHDWQYTFKTQRYSLSGQSAANLTVPLNGQILSLYVRLFDPSAASGVGAPISLSNVSEMDIVYGSGLYRFQDRPNEMQARFFQQHGFLPTNGVAIWDMAVDDLGYLTNAYALNTMNTSGVQVQLTFTGAQSATAYAVVGVEALTYVAA